MIQLKSRRLISYNCIEGKVGKEIKLNKLIPGDNRSLLYSRLEQQKQSSYPERDSRIYTST